MYRSSPFRSTLNTNVITALGMCKVCTEAIYSVARKRQDWTCESTCEHENAKTRKRENGRSTCGRENGENPKTRKRRKRRKRENGENDENKKTAKTGKTRKRENGQKCSCFLVFNFSFSGFLGFLVFSFSGFLVPLAAPFWPGRVFYVLSWNVSLHFCGLIQEPTQLPTRKICLYLKVAEACLAVGHAQDGPQFRDGFSFRSFWKTPSQIHPNWNHQEWFVWILAARCNHLFKTNPNSYKHSYEK